MERVPIRLGRLRTSVAPSAAVAICTVDAGANPGGADLVSASAARVCRVCAQHESRYTCPRCNTPYCGVACYKEHGEACTEQFFEQHVRSELQLMTNENKAAGGGQQKQVAEMLERVRDFQQVHKQRLEEKEGDDDGERLAQRMLELALLDEQGELSLDVLTEQERAWFLSEVADGRLGKFVALWSPWWLLDERTYRHETSARRRSLIMEEIVTDEGEMKPTDDEDEEDEDPASLVSAGAVMIQPEHAFPARIFTDKEAKQVPRDWSKVLPSGRAPSPSLRFHLVEVLFAYVLVMRTFNGDYLQDVSEAAALLLHLSAVLRADARYESLEHVLLVCLEKRTVDAEGAALDMATLGSGKDGNGRDRSQVALHDVAKLLPRPVFVLDALRDAQALVEAYKAELVAIEHDASSKAARKERRAAVKRLGAVEKKIEFFLMWVVLADRSDLEALAIELEAAVSRS